MALSRIKTNSIANDAVTSTKIAPNTVVPVDLAQNVDYIINGLTVGKGGGALATNTVVGSGALAATNSGGYSVAVGQNAGAATTSGQIVAVGSSALFTNSTGSQNTAIGISALYTNTTGSNNVAVGTQPLFSNTTASNNTAVGYQAGYSNTTGGGNTFIGLKAGFSANSTSGDSYNLAVGLQSGYSLTSGNNNTFVGGVNAGYYVTTGSGNTIIGNWNGNQGGLDIRTANNYIVLADGSGNPRVIVNGSGDVSIGTTGNIGQEKLTVVTSADNVAAFFRNSHATSADVVLGLWTDAAKDTTNSILIGINNAQSGNGRVIDIYGNGNIQNINNSYGALSDVKLKENIVDATPKLDDLMKVKVRNYNLIGDTNKQIGVVAQELETVFAGLIDETQDTDRDGNDLGTTTKSVKYSVFVPMLIKAVQELNAKLEAQALEIATLKGQ